MVGNTFSHEDLLVSVLFESILDLLLFNFHKCKLVQSDWYSKIYASGTDSVDIGDHNS